MKQISTYAVLILVTLLGCTRKVNESSLITLTLPQSVSSSKIEYMHTPSNHMSVAQNVTVQSEDDGADWNALLNPATIADVNCYMIAISGPEADMRRNTCSTTTGTNLYVGRWMGAIPAGTQISLEVPSGPQREISVFGFKSINGACRDFKIQDTDSSNLSFPHVIGKTIANLAPGTANVSVGVTVNASTLKIEDCNGPDFNMDHGQGLYFGEELAGTTTINVGTDIISAPIPAAQRGAYAKLNQIVPVTGGIGVDIGTVLGGTFSVGDEVMVIAMAGKGQLGPAANNDYGACGYRGWNGSYSFGKIVSLSSSYSAGYVVNYDFVIAGASILSNMWKNADGDANNFEFDGTSGDDIFATNTRLGFTETNPNFCNIQVVKVPHFYNLAIDPTRVLSAPNFNWNTGGGVLAFRVNGALSLDESSAIETNGKGYPGLVSSVGGGEFGSTTCTPNANSNGGGCGNGSTTAGGGGGHGNTAYPAMGQISGGNGEGTPTAIGGFSVGEDCGDGSCYGTLKHKIFMGGAGGANAGIAGTPGGGIVYIMARNISVGCVGTGGVCTVKPVISSNGNTSGSNGEGAGAGGSVFLGYASSTNFTQTILKADGGGNVDITYDAGPGAGGRIQRLSCINETLPNVTVNAGTLTGTGAVGAMNGSYVSTQATCY